MAPESEKMKVFNRITLKLLVLCWTDSFKLWFAGKVSPLAPPVAGFTRNFFRVGGCGIPALVEIMRGR